MTFHNQILEYNAFIADEKTKKGETATLRYAHYSGKELKQRNSFDIKTTCEIFISRKDSKSECIGTRYDKNGNLSDNFNWLSFSDMYLKNLHFAQGLRKLVICRNINGDFGVKKMLGLYAKNSIDWLVAFYGSHFDSITPVTIFNVTPIDTVESILNQTCLTTILVDEVTIVNIVKLTLNFSLYSIKSVILTGDKSKYNKEVLDIVTKKYSVFTFQEVLDAGSTSENIDLNLSTPESIALICYTSGTTGSPKGAVITQKSFLANLDITNTKGTILSSDDYFISLLPFAHMMGIFIMTVCLFYSVHVGLASSQNKLLEDITIIKPTFICAVPKIAEHIFNTISTNIKQLPPLQRQIVQNIINTKIKFFKKTHCVANNWLSDHIVCDKIRKQFGGRLRFMLVGGATLSAECFNFLKCVLKINVINGYGQTENCASAFLSDEKDYRYDHVGGLCNCLEMKLVDVPELGYFTNNVDPETKVPYPTGELCVRGTTVFKGYYKNSKKTKEVLDDDGWFHTGDICMLLTNHGNAVRIIDRKSNVVKLQNGEFVAIEELETLILSKTKFISQICIIGDSQRPYLVAIVVPKKSQINSDKEALRKSIFEDIVNSYHAVNKYNNIIRAIHIADSPFSLANNMMTPTLKLKRNVIKTVFSKEIEEMYK